MPSIDTESQFKFLISCIKHSTAGKVNFNAVANELQIVSKAAAAKRYERLMKAHGVYPISGGSPGAGSGTSAPTPGAGDTNATAKGKAKATRPARSPKKRKITAYADNNEDDDEDHILECKKQDVEDKKNIKGAKETKPLSKVEKFNQWIDEGSLQLKNIPEAPKSMLAAMEQAGTGADAIVVQGGDEDDEACIVVGVTDLASGMTVGTVPSRMIAQHDSTTAASPTSASSATALSDPLALSSLTPYLSSDCPANISFSLQNPIRTMTRSSSSALSSGAHIGNSSHPTHLASSSPIGFHPYRTDYSLPSISSASPANWVHVPLPHHLFGNIDQDLTGDNTQKHVN